MTPLPLSATALAARLAGIMPVQHLRAPELLDEVCGRWCERQRCWHGPAHLLALVEEIQKTAPAGSEEMLLLTALYHDAIYDPRAADNEAASAALLREHAKDPAAPVIQRACDLILSSKWSEPPADPLTGYFFELDTFQLSAACLLHERAVYEQAIFREFQFAPWRVYRTKRAKFLEQWAARFPEHRKGAAECAELLQALTPRLAVYPGSFDPFHAGHLSILRQAERAFDKVIVAVGINRQKSAASASAGARHDRLRAQLPFHEVAVFEGLLPAFLDDLGATATVVRGVRDGTDLEAELRYARFLDELRPGTSVVWIACEPHLQHLSSSAIRELESIQCGAGQRYLPQAPGIYAALP